ncbi:unnamed protein product [Phytomonas sp. EM1]|nr:unnamed protein product [Phytomonas sp. EM1]|eukprot:CCW63502.1 unnamed protein product [Phytomonas sp. isolate EM1]
MTALAEAELRALEAAFADGDGVDYGAFLAALRVRLAEEKKSTAAPPFSEPFPCTTGSESEGAGGKPGGLQRRYQEVVARIRRQLGGRRARALLAFREEDRARRGYLRAGVFFSCLAALLGSPPAPSEAATLTTALSTGNGEIAYEGFCAAVEDAEPVCGRF